MCASPLSFFRSGPPPPRVALLSDGVFFTRTLPVVASATSAEVAAQVELALETLSPFPVAQLYHGYYWKAGLERAFVFAAYRRRFAAEITQDWPQAKLVLPAFATVFGATVAPATTIVLTAPEGFTAVHWENSALPSRVLFRAITPELSDEDRQRAREELLREVGGSKVVVELSEPPVPEVAGSDDEIVFRSGEFESRLPVAVAAALDVRDKAQLAALRRADARDLWLWRLALGAAAVLLFLLVGEATLKGTGEFWQKNRLAKFKAQAPLVEKIDNAQKLGNRIEELTTKRLLPLEMLSVVSAKKPETIRLLRATTTGLQTLTLDAQTNNASEINLFKTVLRSLPECEKADSSSERSVNGTTTFTLTVTFKPGVLVPTNPLI